LASVNNLHEVGFPLLPITVEEINYPKQTLAFFLQFPITNSIAQVSRLSKK
jgi:hypothetical protein